MQANTEDQHRLLCSVYASMMCHVITPCQLAIISQHSNVWPFGAIIRAMQACADSVPPDTVVRCLLSYVQQSGAAHSALTASAYCRPDLLALAVKDSASSF